MRWLRISVVMGLVAALSALATDTSPPPAQAWSSSDGAIAVWGGGNHGYANDVVVDSSGNIHTCGYLTGNGDVDPNYYDDVSVTETPTGSSSSLVTKLDTAGNLVWSSLMDASGQDEVDDCALDASGNVYVTGRFKGSMDFEDDDSDDVTSLGDYDAYVAKLDSSGAVTWWRVIGGTETVEGHGVDVDSAGNVYFTGTFEGTVDIDPGATTTNVAPVTDSTKSDVFLVKLDSSGNTVWTRHWGGSNIDIANDLEIDSSGYVVTVGNYQDTNAAVNYHPIAGGCTSSCGETLLTGNGHFEGFISRIDADGTLDWVGLVGGGHHDRLMALTTDASDNIYATGYYRGSGTPDFDPGVGSSITLPTMSQFDAYVIKVGSDGNGVWAKAFSTTSGTNIDSGEAVAVDSSGNVYVAGYFRDTVDFDPGVGTTEFTYVGDNPDAFGVKLDASGDLVWAKQIQSTGTMYAFGVDLDSSDNVYISGTLWGAADWDPGTGDAWWAANGSRSDAWVVKWTSSGELAAGNAAWVENAPSGWDVVHGPVDGTDLEGWLSEVVLSTPLCPSGKWEFDHIDGLGHRLYVVEDSALAASGLGIGDYIWEAYAPYSVTMSDYNQLWAGNANDHDGNTSWLSEAFQVRGWASSANANNPVSYYVHESSGILQWEEDGVATGADTEEAPHNGLVPSGYSVYFALANRDSVSRSVSTVENLAATGCVGGVTLSSTTVSATEGGSTGAFTAVLDYQPTSDVVVTVTPSGTDQARVNDTSPSTLTFTAANWSTPQTVTVTAVDDNVDDGNQDVSLTVAVVAASSADEFDGTADQVVTATAVDDDTSGYTLSTTTASVTEGGSTDTFTVVLDTEPTGTVALDVSSADTGEATVSPSTLLFGVFNWFTPQTVTITGANDDVDDGNQDTTVTVAVDAGSTDDTIYDAIAAQTVTATTVDDDVANVTASGMISRDGDESIAELSVTEGGSTTFTIVLDSEPIDIVWVDVLTCCNDDGYFTDPDTLTDPLLEFTPANWDTPQTVTVVGIDDDIDDGDTVFGDDTVILAIMSEDSNYTTFSTALRVTVVDDDTVGFTLSGTSITVTETPLGAASTATFSVVLDTEPT
ncbi:MAG: hypothetical protein V1249_08255, partial [Acidimicrobiales bacterium]|nr:hypothetical protein [Acidimicrobiales bacterium]